MVQYRKVASLRSAAPTPAKSAQGDQAHTTARPMESMRHRLSWWWVDEPSQPHAAQARLRQTAARTFQSRRRLPHPPAPATSLIAPDRGGATPSSPAATLYPHLTPTPPQRSRPGIPAAAAGHGSHALRDAREARRLSRHGRYPHPLRRCGRPRSTAPSPPAAHLPPPSATATAARRRPVLHRLFGRR